MFHPSLDSDNFTADVQFMSKIMQNQEHPISCYFTFLIFNT